MINIKRLNKVLEAMKKDSIYQFVITDPHTIYYLTGVRLSPGNRFLGLYLNQDKEYRLINNMLFPLGDAGIEVTYYNDTESALEKLEHFIKKDEIVGVDKCMASRFLIEMMDLNLAKKYINGSRYVDYVRMQKDEEEIKKMIKASRINDEAMAMVIERIKPGKKELDIVEELKEIYEECGADGGFSFEPIIGFGANAANPHHETDETVIGDNGCLVIDIGCVNDGYCSDMTRTIFLGALSEEEKRVYYTVKEANEIAIEAVKPGVKFSDIDFAARNHIEKAGYGKYFTHRTGHCIGMDCHEFGDVSMIHNEELKEGMIFSVEPGIYITGKVGVRIEDLILVTKDGYKNLNAFTKDLIVKKF